MADDLENSEDVAVPGSQFDMMDQAVSNMQTIPAELQGAMTVARDSLRALDERLEAFEDVLESEVGDTQFTRARNLERSSGFRQLFLKFEGGNPTGTQKDRIAFAQVGDAMRRGFDAVTVATCGNFGVAMGLAASVADMRCVVYIPEPYRTRRIEEMRRLGVEVRRAGVDYEQALRMSMDWAEAEGVYDANPGGRNTAIQLTAYGEIAYEIYDELRDAPAGIAIPVSNGTTLAGIYRGFVSLFRRGKTSRIPRFIAGSSWGKNPIIRAFKTGAAECADLRPDKIRETPINEALINWHSVDGDLGLAAIRNSDGFASDASDRAMRQLSRTLREHEGLSVLPASTAGLSALLELHARKPLPADRYVAVLTGRR